MLEKPTKKKRPLNSYIKYSSLTIQMALIIIIGVFFGEFIDSKRDGGTPIATIFFSLASIAASLLYVFNKIRNEDK